MKKEFEVICKNCGKKFIVIEEETKFPIKGDKYFCCRSCANTRHHSKETKLKISDSVKNSELFIKNNKIAGINKRGIKYNIHKIHKCKNCNREILSQIYNYGKYKYCSKECANLYLNNHKHGGYRKGSGIGKHGYYKGIYCDSTWELAFLIYHLDHNLYIERCKEKRKYIYENKEHIYIPDFITNEGIFEIKGYYNKITYAKANQNKDIIILGKEEIQKYLDYIYNTYNIKNIYDLYDK